MKRLISALISVCFSFSALAGENVVDCENAMTTLDINHCATIELESAQVELEQYLEASFEHNAYDEELVTSIRAAQESWLAYMSAHCDSVYTQWRDGTIRGVMALSCKIRLTKQRTHEVWANFLTYMDSTPAVLPEPKLLKSTSETQ